MRYTLLLSPHANQRYASSAAALSLAELSLLAARLSCPAVNARLISLGRGQALAFDMPAIGREDAFLLYSLSSALTLFSGDGTLIPIPYEDRGFVGADIAGVLKYKGKTNEVFTSFMLNLAWASWGGDTAPRVLDPLCGRGTTVFQALRRGWDSLGVDIDANDIREARHYLKRYLERGRYKHVAEDRGLTLDGKRVGSSMRMTMARNTAEQKAGASRVAELAHCDTLSIHRLWKRASFDLLVADLPYGVQHAGERSTHPSGRKAHSGEHKSKPEDLLRAALPVWKELLSLGGIMALAINAQTLPLPAARAIASEAGLTPLCGEPYDGLEHWGEQAITRDVLVARYDISTKTANPLPPA